MQVWLRVMPANFFRDDLAKLFGVGTRSWGVMITIWNKNILVRKPKMRNILVLVLTFYL